MKDAISGILILSCTVLALIAANSGFYDSYYQFIHAPLLGKTVVHWVNDGLMVIFFLSIGLEIKQEVQDGQLSQFSQILLPSMAALGGIVVPVLLYIAFNHGDPITMRGWAIPAATDIAFALGTLALLGKRIPSSLKLFLMTLAIFDDLVAILVIAFFYTATLSTLYISLALLTLIILFFCNRSDRFPLFVFLIIGLILWVFVLKSGIHATIAGVALSLFIPFKYLKKLQNKLHLWVAFFIMPIFALTNAGVDLRGFSLQTLTHPLPLGIILGLFLGKQLGVFSFSYLVIKSKLAKLPEGTTWGKLYGASILCGIGFTMSLFISSLAFANLSEHYAALSCTGIFIGSLLSAVMGVFFLALI